MLNTAKTTQDFKRILKKYFLISVITKLYYSIYKINANFLGLKVMIDKYLLVLS